MNEPRRGQMIPCPAEGCHAEELRGLASSKTALQTFDNFEGVAGTEKSTEAVLALADGKCLLVLLYGNVGCGKTHLANALKHRLRVEAVEVKMFAVPDLMGYLRTGINTGDADYRVQEMEKVGVLILDDLKTDMLTDWNLEQIERIISYREQNGLRTLVTSNNTLAEIAEKSPRLDDRFGDVRTSWAVWNSAPTYRQTDTRKHTKGAKK